jgi:hypothetical protein
MNTVQNQLSFARAIGRLLLAAVSLFLLPQSNCRADAGGYYSIVQLSFTTNATHPSINNSGEIVWSLQNSNGIFSSVRGQLAASGVSPHIANSGEVVYADSFGTNGLDLVSTTRGRLTYGGIIDLGYSDFGVNSNGEVVYVTLTNGNYQLFSTVRGQISSDPVDNFNPCINDLGEILWTRFGPDSGLVSSTRGLLPGNYSTVYGLNNHDEFCYQNNLVVSNFSTGPHLFSNLHGVVINDIYQYQFWGGINDAGTLIWQAQNQTNYVQFIYKATWVPAPVLTLSTTPGLALEWPANAGAFHAQFSTNLAPPITWQRLSGSPSMISSNFQQTIGSNLGGTAFFRLSINSP